ncbi:MAG: hypothetical protein ACI9DC_003267 [Gammaproteobacteria bacterium]|jgi:hypothetical protein
MSPRNYKVDVAVGKRLLSVETALAVACEVFGGLFMCALSELFREKQSNRRATHDLVIVMRTTTHCLCDPVDKSAGQRESLTYSLELPRPGFAQNVLNLNTFCALSRQPQSSVKIELLHAISQCTEADSETFGGPGLVPTQLFERAQDSEPLHRFEHFVQWTVEIKRLDIARVRNR